MKPLHGLLSVAAVFALLLPPLHTAKAADEGTYVSVWGGISIIDAPEVEGFSTAVNAADVLIKRHRLDADESGFFGVSYGTAIDPAALYFKRIELYFEGQITREDSQSAVNPSGANNIKFGIPTGEIVNGVDYSATAKMKRERYEFGVNLSQGGQMANLGPLNLGLTTFAGFGQEDASSSLAANTNSDFTNTRSDLDWKFFGLMLATDTTIPVSTSLDLILKGSAGVYYYNADADFVSTSNNANNISQRADSDNDFGFRGKLSAELRAKLSEGVVVSFFGGVDYLSDVPYAQLTDSTKPRFSFQTPPQIGSDDLIDLKAGIKLTISLDSQ